MVFEREERVVERRVKGQGVNNIEPITVHFLNRSYRRFFFSLIFINILNTQAQYFILDHTCSVRERNIKYLL